uniref:Uncharacterized protein n=1 Tax=Arundo donax TaxID=35708 RepID=A0A0A9ESA6_ARUDO
MPGFDSPWERIKRGWIKKGPSSAIPSYTRNHYGCLQRDTCGPRVLGVLGTLWRVRTVGLWGLFSTGSGRDSS